jgi:hypothetical protein
MGRNHAHRRSGRQCTKLAGTPHFLVFHSPLAIGHWLLLGDSRPSTLDSRTKWHGSLPSAIFICCNPLPFNSLEKTASLPPPVFGAKQCHFYRGPPLCFAPVSVSIGIIRVSGFGFLPSTVGLAKEDSAIGFRLSAAGVLLFARRFPVSPSRRFIRPIQLAICGLQFSICNPPIFRPRTAQDG